MTQTPPFISIISPVYKAERIVDELIKRIEEEIVKVTPTYEIILIEDGSPDNSWQRIEAACLHNKNVKGIKLSRNFGQHFAITAGIEHAKGDYVIVMDCDLQDDPVYFPELYQKTQEGFDIVYTNKVSREHSVIKNVTARLFNSVFNYLVDNKDWKSHHNVGAYSMLSRKVADAFCQFNDYQRHYLIVLRWLGFRHTYLEIQHKKRFEGKSSYNMSKLLMHAINGITSQSDKLLRLTVVAGLFLSFLSLLAIVIVITLYFLQGFMSGWTSLIVTILFSTGILLTSVGISGIYIGKTFEQTKGRPRYLIDIFLNRNN